MATTTHYGWPAPVETDTYDIEQYTEALNDIDELIYEANEAIEALDVGSDVIDIVGVYDMDNYPYPHPSTDLVHYDYSKLKTGDIIKVLQDESQISLTEIFEDAPISYYRKIEPVNPGDLPFTLIGTLGPFPTKSEIQRMMPTVEDEILPGQYRWVDITTEMLNKGIILYESNGSKRSDETDGNLLDTSLTYNKIIDLAFYETEGEELENDIYTNDGNTWSLSSDKFTAFVYKYSPPGQSMTWENPEENKDKYAVCYRDATTDYPKIYQSRFVPDEP